VSLEVILEVSLKLSLEFKSYVLLLKQITDFNIYQTIKGAVMYIAIDGTICSTLEEAKSINQEYR
jgi:hypothetical protein